MEAPEKYTSIIDSSFHVEYMKAELLSENSPFHSGSADHKSLLQLVKEIEDTCINFTSLTSIVEKKFGNYIYNYFILTCSISCFIYNKELNFF